MLTCLTLIAAANLVGVAQSRPNPAPAAQTPLVEFDAKPVAVPDLEIEIMLPVGAYYDAHEFAGGRKRVRVADNAWALHIYNSNSPDKDITPTQVLDGLLDARRELLQREQPFVVVKGSPEVDPDDGPVTVGVRLRTLQRFDNLVIAGRPAARIYFDIPSQPRGYVTSYTVVKTPSQRHLVFQFDTPRANLKGVQGVHETIVGSINFIEPDPDQIAAQTAALLAGDAFLDTLTTDDLRAALPDAPVFLRIYEPAPSGADADAKEIAFQKVQIRDGQLGELNPEKPKIYWKSVEREVGFLVKVEGRFLDVNRTIDIRAIFWLSRDFSRESWAVTTTATAVAARGTLGPDGSRNKVTFEQNLERVDDRMTVRDVKPGVTPEVRDWETPPKAYIPGVTLYLLPRLVAQKDIATELGFYHYHLQKASVALRRDDFRKSKFGWERRESRSKQDDSRFISSYTLDGDLVSSDWPNGAVMEPIDEDRLYRLWKSKGLLTGR